MKPDYGAIADALIAKKPDLAPVRDDLIGEIEMLDCFVSDEFGIDDRMKAEVRAQLCLESKADPALRRQVDDAFAFWGISLEKFSAFFGAPSTEDGYKLIAMTLRINPETTVDREALKTFILIKLRPAVDLSIE